MHVFRLWAPYAKKVGVKIDGRVYLLEKLAKGWWELALESATYSTDYVYLLDDNDLELPDPRSLWQPHGVHGPSRVFDQTLFQWTDASWQAPPLEQAVVYELHIGTFTPEGTFNAALKHLDYLKKLGITHVQLMPVASFPGKYGWGYDGVDLFAPHEPYGGPEALKHFVDACHAHALAVLLDVVYNHLGPSGNYLAKFGPYFTSAHQTPWGDGVNLEEAGSHEVRRFFCDNALMWLREYHIDGLRLDAVHAFIDRSAIHFMEQIANEVRQLQDQTGKRYVVIAESDLNDPRLIRAHEAGGYEMDSQWSDDFHHALVALLTGDRGGYYADFGSFADLAKSLKHAYVYDGRYSQYRDRMHGRPADGLPGSRFLGYSQNHDQVGNRAKGERLVHLANIDRARIAAVLMLTAPFVPMLFQGEEWASSSPFQYFTDHDEELGRLVSEGRKKEFAAFGWNPNDIPDPQSLETVEHSKLRWDEIEKQPHAAMLDWYKQLIQLRRDSPALKDGDLSKVDVQFSEEGKWLTMQRGQFQIAVNLSSHEAQFQVTSAAEVVLASNKSIAVNSGQLLLPSDSVVILRNAQ